MDDVRDADAPWRCQPLEPGRHVDAIAVDVVAIDDHVAEVDPDPELDAVLRLEVRVVQGDALLHLDRALDGVNHARELDQRAVARELDRPAAALGDLGIDEVLAKRLEPGVRACLVLAHQPTVTDHIGGEDRGELAFELLRSHRWALSGATCAQFAGAGRIMYQE